MRKIAWTPKSLRAYKRLIRQNPQMRTAIEETLRQLANDPFHTTLKTHKLSGELMVFGQLQLTTVIAFCSS